MSGRPQASGFRALLTWGGLLCLLLVPPSAAAFSPLTAWRDLIYIVAGLAGILALSLVVLQLLLIGGFVPAAKGLRARRVHKWVGFLLVAAVSIHLIGLWITSPPDVVDALLFRSPTPFSAWGVFALWSVFAALLMVLLRTRLAIRPRNWRRIHVGLALVTGVGSVVHTALIQGTMEAVSKTGVCLLLMLLLGKVILLPGVRAAWRRSRS